MGEPYVSNGDAGYGAPGSPRWHRVWIAQMTDQEVIEHIKEAFDMSVQEIALEIIDGHCS